MSAVTTTNQEARPIDTVRGALEKMKSQFAMALPKHLTPDRLLRVALTAVQNTPKLLECDRTSLYSAIMTCAQLGLEPDGVLGQAYLVPFAGKVQFIPGYKGLISLARNSGDVVSIIAHEVCTNDSFGHWNPRTERYELNMAAAEPPEHRIPDDGERGDIKRFYAIARFKDGGCHWDAMTKAEVDKIRDDSQGWKAAVASSKKYNKPINSPWFTNYPEMGKKTLIRRISKYLPLSVQKAAAMSDALDTGRHAHIDKYGDVVIDATATTPIGTEGQIAPPSAAKLDRFEEDAPKDGEVLTPGDQTPHDPVTGEIQGDNKGETVIDPGEQNEADQTVERNPLWARDSYEISLPPDGKNQLPLWVQWFVQAAGDALTIAELTKLDIDNAGPMGVVKAKRTDLYSEIRTAMKDQHGALAGAEGI